MYILFLFVCLPQFSRRSWISLQQFSFLSFFIYFFLFSSIFSAQFHTINALRQLSINYRDIESIMCDFYRLNKLYIVFIYFHILCNYKLLRITHSSSHIIYIF